MKCPNESKFKSIFNEIRELQCFQQLPKLQFIPQTKLQTSEDLEPSKQIMDYFYDALFLCLYFTA